MTRPKQYEYDEERAKLNKEILKTRKGWKWKYAEILDNLDIEVRAEGAKYQQLLLNYEWIAKTAKLRKEEEILQRALNGRRYASGCIRKGLLARVDHRVRYAMPLEFVPSDLYHWLIPLNPRTYRRLRADISQRGILNPLVVTETMEIIDGHYRAQIAMELELEEVPYFTVNLGGMEPVERLNTILDLGFSLNLDRRQMNVEQRKATNRYWDMVKARHKVRGRPTKKEKEVEAKIEEVGKEKLSDSERVEIVVMGG